MFLVSKILSFVGRLYTIVMMPQGVVRGRHSCLSFCDGHSINGGSNLLEFGDKCQLSHCRFVIKGSHNKVIVGSDCRLSGVTFWIQDNNNTIIIGNKTSMGHGTELAALEGTRIDIGEDCMLSNRIQIRTSDSHSIIDEKNVRINHARDVVIEDHCWIGMECLIMKGALLRRNSVLGARSVLTSSSYNAGCVLAGAPAKVVRENINWDRKRL